MQSRSIVPYTLSLIDETNLILPHDRIERINSRETLNVNRKALLRINSYAFSLSKTNYYFTRALKKDENVKRSKHFLNYLSMSSY